MSDLPIVALGEIVRVKGGKRLPKGSTLQTVPNDHPYIRVRDMGQRYIPDTGLEYVPDEVFPNIQRYIVEENDVIISIVGTIGLVSVIDERFHLASQTENCAKLSGLDRNDALYVYYYLSSNIGQQSIKEATVGAVQAKLPLYNIEKIPVIWPARKERQLIVSNLDALDDKIELNRQINQTLEQIAQAIFKSWFVDFEPVKAKIQAKQNGQDSERAAMRAISGKTDEELDAHGRANAGGAGSAGAADQLGSDWLKQLAATAALFPDELEGSELGEIPKGWEVSDIGNEFDVTMGQSPPGDTYNEVGEGMPFFQGRRDFGWRYPANRVYCTAPKRLAKKGDTLLSVRAPVGDVNKAISDCCIGRGISALRHKSGCEAYSYYSMKRLEQHFNSFDSEGTVFGSINQKDLKAIKTIKPNVEILEEFTQIVGVIDKEIRVLDEEIATLSSMRDALLPKLLSGDITPNNETQDMEVA